MAESKALDAAAMLADRKAGMTYAAIGDKHGCSDVTAITRVRAAAAAAGEPVPQSAFPKQSEKSSASPHKQPVKSHASRGLDGDAIRADHAAGLGTRRLARKYQWAESVIRYHLKKPNNEAKSEDLRRAVHRPSTSDRPTNKPLKAFTAPSSQEPQPERCVVRMTESALDTIWNLLSMERKAELIGRL